MEQKWTSRIDVSLFDCAHCRKFLSPPSFKCDAGHVVCQGCCDAHLQVCSDAVTKSCIPCPDRDLALRAPMLSCVHRVHGCTALLAYHEWADHVSSCNLAPWTSQIHASVFDCAHCRRSLKPPTFKCDAGHVVCQDCCDGHLQVCVNKPCIPCPDVDGALGAPMLFCVHREHGCTARLAYHESAEHLRSCNSAPCRCPECSFKSSPAALLQHISEHHEWPVLHKYVYGQPWKVSIRRGDWTWCGAALAGESDGQVFLVLTRPTSMAHMTGVAVWVVCLRASEDAQAVARQFRCELWIKGGGGTKGTFFSCRPVPSSDGSSLPSNMSMVLKVPDYLQLSSKAALMVRIHKDGGEASSSDDDVSSGDEAGQEDAGSGSAEEDGVSPSPSP